MRTPSEIEFFNLFPGAKEATKDEDMFQHFDLTIPQGKVDVKGLKRINRNDSTFTYEYHWVEFQNVRGNKGWVYGDADYIAFEIPEGYLLVDREALLTMCREKVVDRKVGNIKEVYKLYNRQGRKDILTLVKISDLESIAYKKIIIDGKERNLSRP